MHVIGPELGLTQPGMTIVCGDSHTSTHGAFGALAFGIGTSEVEHVLATQCVVQVGPERWRCGSTGTPQPGVYAKDLILALIRRIGTAGGAGHVIEYTGEAIRALSMEGRMTVCNMSIEAGARAGMIAPDEMTFAYLRAAPPGSEGQDWSGAVEPGDRSASDPGARYDRKVVLDVGSVAPQVTWGTSPGMTADIAGRVPDPRDIAVESERESLPARAGRTWGSSPARRSKVSRSTGSFSAPAPTRGSKICGAAASVIAGRRVARGVRAMVVPGSQQVKAAAEREGLDRIFTDAGFEWRNPGCSMCLGMNEDVLGRASAVPPPRTGTSKAGRDGAAAPI